MGRARRLLEGRRDCAIRLGRCQRQVPSSLLPRLHELREARVERTALHGRLS